MTPKASGPDWGHWTRMDEWTLGEAICLLLRVDPASWPGTSIKELRTPGMASAAQVAIWERAEKIADLAWASHRKGKLGISVHQSIDGLGSPPALVPSEWLAWALGKGIEIPEELKSLVPKSARQTAARADDRIRRESQTPAAEEPDAGYWTREDEWELLNAALLLVNLEPRRGLGLHLRKMINGEVDEDFREAHEWPSGLSDSAQALLRTVEDIVRRADVARQRRDLRFVRFEGLPRERKLVEPQPFLIWARDKRYDVPASLEPILDGEPSREQLKREVAKLRNELDSKWKFDPDAAHFPRELDIATIAWRTVSNETSPADRTVKQRLQSWIQSNYRDLPLEAIERIATVANWQKGPGRKPAQKK